MLLKKYLEKERLTMREFAQKAQVSESLISYICTRTRDIMTSIALRISEATDEEVTIKELIPLSIATKRVSRYREPKSVKKVIPEEPSTGRPKKPPGTNSRGKNRQNTSK